MIVQNLHTNPVALDREQHRALKLRLPVTDWGVSRRLNALFVAAVEFSDVARDFPIVFIRAGKEDDGRDQIAPIAVLGMVNNENLYEEGGTWRADYIPAVLRCYPFCIGRINAESFAVCVDYAWPGINSEEGEATFDANGEPTELLKQMQQHLETLETEVQRTRLVGQRLLELDLLRDMRFDATLPNGRQHSVDGFLTVDIDKVNALPDATVLQLHREGILGLIHAHWLSMGNMRRLADWYAAREAASAPAAPAATAA
jgi:hypothetical protein